MAGDPPQLLARRERAEAIIDAVLDRVRTTTVELRSESVANAEKLIGPSSESVLPSTWRRPDGDMAQITNWQVAGALNAVRRAAQERGLDRVPTGISSYPYASLQIDREGSAVEWAPLVAFCTDPALYEELVRAFIKPHSKLTRDKLTAKEAEFYGISYQFDAYPEDRADPIMEAANLFLKIEGNLWRIARQGGFRRAVPYPVRYHAAACLWSPRIAGFAFCLRCGDDIGYKRVGRKSGTRQRKVPVCGPCLQSGIDAWPEHAVMPNSRGTWWLWCQRRDCGHAFVGAGQARYCHEHRSNRLTRKERIQRLATHRD